MKKSKKALSTWIVVPVGLLFIIVISFGIKAASHLNLVQSHVLVEQEFSFETKFNNLIGQSNQLLSVKSSENFPVQLKANKQIIDKLSYWLAFYAHANESKSNLKLNVTDPLYKEALLEEIKFNITQQLNDTAKLILPDEIFYSMKFKDIIVKNTIGDRPIQTFGSVILPIPIPGGKIEYFSLGREETSYNLILTESD